MKQRIFDKLEKSMKHHSQQQTINEKKRITELIHLLNKLNEIIEESSEKSIEKRLDMLGHKLNVITKNDSTKYSNTLSSKRNELLQSNNSLHQNQSEFFYIEHLLMQCGLSLNDKHNNNNKKLSKLTMLQEKSECTHDLILNVIENFIWPDIFERIEQRTNRPQITVDLHRLTSEEKLMIEDVANECVETLIEKSLII